MRHKATQQDSNVKLFRASFVPDLLREALPRDVESGAFHLSTLDDTARTKLTDFLTGFWRFAFRHADVVVEVAVDCGALPSLHEWLELMPKAQSRLVVMFDPDLELAQVHSYWVSRCAQLIRERPKTIGQVEEWTLPPADLTPVTAESTSDVYTVVTANASGVTRLRRLLEEE